MSDVQVGSLIAAITVDTVIITIVIAVWASAILAAIKERKP